jgi:hypothetical protein
MALPSGHGVFLLALLSIDDFMTEMQDVPAAGLAKAWPAIYR